MRAPLMGIQANTDILMSRFKSKFRGELEMIKMLSLAKSSASLLETLVNDILDSARISKGIFFVFL